ncbi:MAG: prepilin-type N-terminal cleavage/methylation domain-containing protein [Candidatus Muiribacteriota bacterium]
MRIVELLTKQKKIIKNENGFTLVELMVAIVIGLIVTVAVSGFFISEKRVYESQTNIIDMQQDLRTSISLMTSEIRMIGYNPLKSSDFDVDKAIETIGDDHIIFLADFNENGTLEADTERIRYKLDDGTLYRALGAKKADGTEDNNFLEPIAENVDAFDLVYLNEDGDETTDHEEIRAVQIAIVVRSGTSVSSSQIGGSDNHKFENLQGDEIFVAEEGERFIRRILLNEVKCRNLGINL